ncbi:MAG: cyclic nucleotide-binding domain-containing protein [Anaerolineaceae bacterium]|nr:cyclic nucleotide-binding domain-containing protein [Anaerolineaceae bacterium]
MTDGFLSDLGNYSLAGEVFSLSELLKRYDIAKEEFESFRPFARIYPKGSMIIREGDKDKTLFLIRSGSVGVFRKIGDKRESFGSIEAINFVGEMSLINDAPRTATIIAVTDDVLIYAITSPNLSLILANPKWSEILLTRFSKDLRQNNAQLVTASNTIHDLNSEVGRLQSELEKQKQALADLQGKIPSLVNIILALTGVARDQAVFGTKGWFYFQLVSESLEHFAQNYFPFGNYSARQANLKEIREHLDAAQKAETRPNLSGVYETIKKDIENKAH